MRKEQAREIEVTKTKKQNAITVASPIKDLSKQLQGKYSPIQAMKYINADKVALKDQELRDMAIKMKADRNASNIVSLPFVMSNMSVPIVFIYL